jgi:hypothetical protein
MIDEQPEAIIFYNSAVKLMSNDSLVLDSLISTSNSGVVLIACGTCVGFFGLEDKIKIDRVSNMLEIVRILTKSEKVIKP